MEFLKDSLKIEIFETLKNQKFGVLTRIKNNNLHSCLISYAETPQLQSLYFFLVDHSLDHDRNSAFSPQQASLFISTATGQPMDITTAKNIAIYGNFSALLKENQGSQALIHQYFLPKHPYLAEFISSSSTTLIEFHVDYYEFVSNFQGVIHFLPAIEFNGKPKIEILQLRALHFKGDKIQAPIVEIRSKAELEKILQSNRAVNTEKNTFPTPIILCIDHWHPSYQILWKFYNILALVEISPDLLDPISSIQHYFHDLHIKAYLGGLPYLDAMISSGDQIFIDGSIGIIKKNL